MTALQDQFDEITDSTRSLARTAPAISIFE